MKHDPQPDEFRAKPAWQRLLIMVGGVLMNVVLAFLIYVGMSWKWGDSYLATDDMRYGYVFSDQARGMGYRDGDRILSVNGEAYDDFRLLRMALLLDQQADIVVLRDGDTVRFRTPEASVLAMAEDPAFITPRYPFLIGQVVPGSGAEAAGLQVGDRLVGLDGEELRYFDQYIERFPELKGQEASLTVERDSAGVTLRRDVTVAVSPEGRIGAAVDMLAVTPVHTREYTPLAGDSCRMAPHRRRDRQLLETAETGLPARDGGLQVAGRPHCHRQHLPRTVELAGLLGDHGAVVHHSGRDEHSAHSGARRRPRSLPAGGGDYGAAAERQVHDLCPDCGHGPALRPDDLCDEQRPATAVLPEQINCTRHGESQESLFLFGLRL